MVRARSLIRRVLFDATPARERNQGAQEMKTLLFR